MIQYFCILGYKLFQSPTWQKCNKIAKLYFVEVFRYSFSETGIPIFFIRLKTILSLSDRYETFHTD